MKLMIDPSLVYNPKVIKLARHLGVTPTQTVGHLVVIWGWTLVHRGSGSISGLDASEIAHAAHWLKRPVRKFLDGLIECGFVDQGSEMQLHDWHKFQGPYFEKLERDKERQRAIRVAAKSPRQDGDVACPFPSHPFPSQSFPSHPGSRATDGRSTTSEGIASRDGPERTDGPDPLKTFGPNPCPKGCTDGFLESLKACCTCEAGRRRARIFARGLERERAAASPKPSPPLAAPVAELVQDLAAGMTPPHRLDAAQRIATMPEAEARRLVAELVAEEPQLEDLTATRSAREVLRLCASKLNGRLELAP